jgi:hypothetical protein
MQLPEQIVETKNPAVGPGSNIKNDRPSRLQTHV